MTEKFNRIVTKWFDPFFGLGYNVMNPSIHKDAQMLGNILEAYWVYLGAFLCVCTQLGLHVRLVRVWANVLFGAKKRAKPFSNN